MPPGSQPGSLVHRCWGRCPGGRGGAPGQHLGQEGLDVCSPMGVTSLPASRHVPICISCARNFPAASRVTWKEEGGEEVPPPQQLAHKAAPG